MLISLNWIREHCPFETDETIVRIGERFSLATAEVEGAVARGENLADVIAVRVENVESVPGKRLTKVTVDTGKDKVTVACGAPNVASGMIVPYAAPGVTILGNKLEKRKVAGILSEGMLLAEDELEISDSHEGLMVLADTIEPGTSLAEIYPGLRDGILEVDNKSLTHRPDLWGHFGIAREFATIYGAAIKPYGGREALASADGSAAIEVSIQDGEASRRCRRYCGLQIDGVKVAPSPEWLCQRLHAIGSRPINNIVDITNYILFDLGQPLHAFDRERLDGGEILVRMPKDGESMTLLDGRTIQLSEEDLLIADGKKPVALAGVMGGENSEIVDSTASLFLESANFEPVSVRRSSLRHGRTDSSARFEKSLDPEQARLGILRAAEMVLELCPGACVVGSLQDLGYERPEPIVIELEEDFIPKRLGADLSSAAVKDILGGLGFEVDTGKRAAKKPTSWKVTVPTWRATRDIAIREDLVEEVGRIHGYGAIVPYAPKWPVQAPAINERRAFERAAKSFLALQCGFNEVYTYAMVGEEHCRSFGLDPETHLKLQNPMSEDLDRMRREIVPQHLDKAGGNERYFDRFAFFEIGRVYRKDPADLKSPELPDERSRIAGVVVYPESSDDNFFELRRQLLSLHEHLGLEKPEVSPLDDDASAAWIHPNVSGRLEVVGGNNGGERTTCGLLYRVHPDFHQKLELRGDVYAFDLDFETLFETPRRNVQYRKLSRFPAVPFDVSVVAGERVAAKNLLEVIRGAAGALLRNVDVFDVYQGEGIEAGKKSITFQLVFQSDDHTLAPEEVETLQNTVIQALERAGFPLRS